jgi:DNA-binding NarL/FixJ family response regulator
MMNIIIWIIEDNAAFRSATLRALRHDSNFKQVCAYENCEDALESLNRGKRPNIILMDIGLPGIDGIEGIRRIKAVASEVNIVLLTVFDDAERIFRAICAGASGYLLKSEPMQRVVEAVHQVMTGGSPMNPQVARKVLQMFTKLDTPEKDYGINERERLVLLLMVDGLAKKQIADRLHLNQHTVDYVIRCIYQKLHVHCLAAAVSLAVKEKLLHPILNRHQK